MSKAVNSPIAKRLHQELVQIIPDFKLGHAYELIAKSCGFSNWNQASAAGVNFKKSFDSCFTDECNSPAPLMQPLAVNQLSENDSKTELDNNVIDDHADYKNAYTAAEKIKLPKVVLKRVLKTYAWYSSVRTSTLPDPWYYYVESQVLYDKLSLLILKAIDEEEFERGFYEALLVRARRL